MAASHQLRLGLRPIIAIQLLRLRAGSASVRHSSWVASVVMGILFQASRADDGLRQAWRRRIWKAVAMTLSLFLTRE